LLSALLSALLAAGPQSTGPATAAFLELEHHSPAVRDGRLVEDVGIETLGGAFTALLARNQVVPAEKTETFSTGADNQQQIEIRVLRGLATTAGKNALVGRFAVDQIPRAPRGTIMVAVTFAVTADGAITVSARESRGRSVGVRPAAEPGIQSFDCTSSDETKRGESLRARKSGGPDGATWNWYGADLLCAVVVRGACDGTARIALDLGRKTAARAAVTLSPRDPSTQELRVSARAWQRALQRRREVVYETLPLRVRVDAKCSDGARHGSAGTWSDNFVGAFSGGE
jgi:hypothetical protein